MGSESDSKDVAGPFEAELLRLASEVERPDELLRQALPQLLVRCGGTYAAMAVPETTGWRAVVDAGQPTQLPADLLSEVLDREAAVRTDEFSAIPIRPGTPSAQVLVVHGGQSADEVERLASSLATAVELLRTRQRSQSRISRLEAILEIAQSWYRTNEMEPLLVQMAEAATRLFDSDRASIFLWDRPNKTLVGRPALGIEGGELRIADDTGLVGRVVHSGEPERVGSADTEASIDRSVEAQTGYRIRTLLCVPLKSPSGNLLGAFELLNKHKGDFTDEDQRGLTELAMHAAVALENTKQLEDLVAAQRQLVDQAAGSVQLIGKSAAIDALRLTVERVADTDLAILILGENGTGKEVVSRQIHYLSRRRDKPLISVNCAALTETLLESELFGHEKGAFTDAHASRPGKFELATGGTLFLDEIGEMSPSGQAKLLRVLEDKTVVRVGGSTPIHTDARVLAATNQKLAEMVTARRFREDLYYRLNVITLELPPLRDRGNDVLLLAETFLDQFCHDAHRKTPKFTAAAKERLLQHAWPGNVRELRNLMERLAYLSSEDRIDAEDLAFILSPGKDSPDTIDTRLPLTEATRQFQVRYITAAIESGGGHMSRAAGRLGLHRSNLYRKMRQLGMDVAGDGEEA